MRLSNAFVELYRRLTKPNELPVLADTRALDLYYAQVDLHGAEAAVEVAQFELDKANALVDSLTSRVIRLSGGTLPRTDADPFAAVASDTDE